MKIHRHRYQHAGCINDPDDDESWDCMTCFDANWKCTFENPWCWDQYSTWQIVWGLIFLLLMSVIFVLAVTGS